MLLASPVTNKVPEFTRAPLIAVVGACSLGKTATNTLLLNHFSDRVYTENGTTKSQSLPGSQDQNYIQDHLWR